MFYFLQLTFFFINNVYFCNGLYYTLYGKCEQNHVRRMNGKHLQNNVRLMNGKCEQNTVACFREKNGYYLQKSNYEFLWCTNPKQMFTLLICL